MKTELPFDIVQFGDAFPAASGTDSITIYGSVQIPMALLFSVRLEYENLPPNTDLNQFYELKMSGEGYYCIRVPKTFVQVCFGLASELKLELMSIDEEVRELRTKDAYFVINPAFTRAIATTDELYRNAVKDEYEAINAIFRAHGEMPLPEPFF